ncbi:BadF/BadG/BcrA/BcrD ATPase family protein [Arthrobacter sp. LAPM80]|uniref:N-acetylglucosamine kinase n=1 Tax=Arthrobacter sp. LAPM80 TaxID=3141788 RepID=UPI00398B5D72
MLNFLAIDAGGTSTRAVILDSAGHCLGYGTAGGGNPVSRGFEPALDALCEASREALGDVPRTLSGALVAMAGASLELPSHLYGPRFISLGLIGEVVIESDLLAAFYSGTYQDDGRALIAGTGAVGARISGSRLAEVADGTGWLLGDEGSGFWLGREVARAVASALDGRGRATALTALVLTELGIADDPGTRSQGRFRTQQQLILKVYERSSIEVSRFAPMVFAVKDDAVAKDIIERAADALARTLLAVSRTAEVGEAGGAVTGEAGAPPLVFGGSVLTKGGSVAAGVVDRLAASAGSVVSPVLVGDGVVGAAVMVLKRHGIDVDAAIFARIQGTLAGLRG